jgi:hypothetical protein
MRQRITSFAYSRRNMPPFPLKMPPSFCVFRQRFLRPVQAAEHARTLAQHVVHHLGKWPGGVWRRRHWAAEARAAEARAAQARAVEAQAAEARAVEAQAAEARAVEQASTPAFTLAHAHPRPRLHTRPRPRHTERPKAKGQLPKPTALRPAPSPSAGTCAGISGAAVHRRLAAGMVGGVRLTTTHDYYTPLTMHTHACR